MGDAPPSYTEATGRPTITHRPADSNNGLLQPKSRNGINPDLRRSMEDESRELPPGWVRQYDTQHAHLFFVDTNANPPRSIWHHPYDDDTYLKTLPAEERERIQELTRRPSLPDIAAESTDDEADDHAGSSSATASSSTGRRHAAELPPRPSKHEKESGGSKFGRRMKDKLTGTTHEQRVAERKRREEEERRVHAQYMAYRAALQKAAQTGERQLLGHDRNGKEVWVEPPMQDPYGGGMGPYGGGFAAPYGNPYGGPGRLGMYPGMQSRYVSPGYPYSQRPYGRGYGGGYGLPLAGGLLGGALLGSLLI